MKVVTSIDALREELAVARHNGQKIGLVPTMGYLHAGHMSLVRQAAADNDVVVVSIFVNPIQFGANEDLATYPRDLAHDTELAAANGANLIFAPPASEMYAADFSTSVNVAGVSANLCGKSRPVHFAGVATVIVKLLNIVAPQHIYFGQKDGQQAAVIRRMVRDLNFDVQVMVMPIVREADGLALSSRNVYLSAAEREQALVLSRSLQMAQSAHQAGENNSAVLIALVREKINSSSIAVIEYVQIVDAMSMEDVSEIKSPAMLALAVRFGTTRLIDNIVLK